MSKTTKKRIIEDIISVAAGAGMFWNPVDEYFDYNDDYSSCLARLIRGLSFRYEMPEKKIMGGVHHLHFFDTPESTAQHILRCFEAEEHE